MGTTYGFDARYSLSPAAIFNGYLAASNDGERRHGTSYLLRADYNRDLIGARAERLSVDANFIPEVGFLRRTDFLRNYGQLRYSPRPRQEWLRGVRKITYRASMAAYSSGSGERLFEEKQAQINMDLQSSDRLDVQYEREYELVPRAFPHSRSQAVPAGSYDSDGIKFGYLRGAHRRIGGWFVLESGRFYGGTRRRLEYKAGRIVLSSRVQIEPSIAGNWIDLPGGRLVATVVSTRPTASLTPRFFASALLQYNSGSETLSTNLRVRWEYRSGSELFVVYSDGRDTGLRGTPIQNRARVVKMNRLLMF
jgi:hypothetical protein